MPRVRPRGAGPGRWTGSGCGLRCRKKDSDKWGTRGYDYLTPRAPFFVGFQCHCQWVLIVHILCTRVQCARAIEDVSALWHLWRRAAAGAERRSAVVVYWKKEEQEETAMANAIYEKLPGSVIRRRTG